MLKRKLVSSVVRAAFPLAVLSLSTIPAKAAQSVQVTLDPERTSINWTLSATLHTVHGSFKLKSGQIAFNLANGTASGELVVDGTSGESGNRSRDDKMQKDVLETKRYPEITFLPKKVIGKVPVQGSATIQIQGTFHIHGANHDLTLSVPIESSGNEAKATTVFTIPYQAWGMKNPGNLLLHVDDKVQVNVTAVGHLKMSGSPH